MSCRALIDPAMPMSFGEALWLLSADHETGILAGNPPRELVITCIRDDLIELCPNSTSWKLSPKGWVIWVSLIARGQ